MRTRNVLGVLAAVALLACSAGGSHEESACRDCPDSLIRLASLNSSVGPIMPTMTPSVARLSAGDYVVTYMGAPRPQIVLYDSTGKVRRIHEAIGQGPGELMASPILFVDGGDTIIAIDQRRIVRFDRTLKHISTTRSDVGFRMTGAVLNSGDLVSNRGLAGSGGTWHQLSLVDRTGALKAALDPTDQLRDNVHLVIGADPNGGFWTIPTNSQEIVRWSADFERAQSLHIDRASFIPWTVQTPGAPFSALPQAENTGVVVLGSSRVMLSAFVADSQWRPHNGTINVQALRISDLFDSTIDVINTDNGEVIASVRSREAMLPIHNFAGGFFSARQDDIGHVVIDVWYCTCVERTQNPAAGQAAAK